MLRDNSIVEDITTIVRTLPTDQQVIIKTYVQSLAVRREVDSLAQLFAEPDTSPRFKVIIGGLHKAK